MHLGLSTSGFEALCLVSSISTCLPPHCPDILPNALAISSPEAFTLTSLSAEELWGDTQVTGRVWADAVACGGTEDLGVLTCGLVSAEWSALRDLQDKKLEI